MPKLPDAGRSAKPPKELGGGVTRPPERTTPLPSTAPIPLPPIREEVTPGGPMLRTPQGYEVFRPIGVDQVRTDVISDINRRVAAFSPDLIHDAPWTVVSTARAPIPTEWVEAIGGGLSQTWGWIKARNSLYPGDAALMAAKARLLRIADPLTRRVALNALADPDIQDAVFAQGVGGGEGQVVTLHQDDPNSDVAKFRAALVSYLTGARVQFQTEHGIKQFVAEAGGIAEGLGRGLAVGFNATVQTVMKPFDVVGHLGSESTDYLARHPEQATLGLAAIPGVKQLARAVGAGASIVVHRGIGGAARIVNVGVQRGTDIAIGGEVAPFALARQTFARTEDQDISNFELLRSYVFPREAGMGAGHAFADIVGVKPTDPAYNDIVAGVSGLAQLYVGAKMFAIPREIREARTVIHEPTPSEPVGVVRATGRIVRDPLRPIAEWAVKATEHTVEDFFDSRSFRKGFLPDLYDTVKRAVITERAPGEVTIAGPTASGRVMTRPATREVSVAAAELTVRHGVEAMPPELAAELVDAVRAGAERPEIADLMQSYYRGRASQLQLERDYVRMTQIHDELFGTREYPAPGYSPESARLWADDLLAKIREHAETRVPGTKVLDTNGQPLRVYHGTIRHTEGLPSTSKASPGALYGPGLYFTDEPAIASEYASSDVFGVGENVTPAYLSIRNPVLMDSAASADLRTGLVEQMRARIQGQPVAEPEFMQRMADAKTNHDLYRASENFLLDNGSDPTRIRGAINDSLRALGYDGIEYQGGLRTGGPRHRAFVVFEDRQVVGGIGGPGLIPEMPFRDGVPVDDKMRLIAELDQIHERLGPRSTFVREPAFRYPDAGILHSKRAFRAIVTDHPTNMFERGVAWLYNPKGRFRFPGPSRFFDDFGGSTPLRTIYDIRRSDLPADARARTVEYLQGSLNRVGVRTAEIDRVIQTYIDTGNSKLTADAWANALRGAKTVSADRILDVATYTKNEGPESREFSILNFRGVDPDSRIAAPSRGSILKTENGTNLPGMTSELSGHIVMPGMDELIDASSRTRALSRRAARGEFGKLGAGSAAVNRFIRGSSNVATAIFKPSVLAFRVPAVAMRVTGELLIGGKMAGLDLQIARRVGEALINSTEAGLSLINDLTHVFRQDPVRVRALETLRDKIRTGEIIEPISDPRELGGILPEAMFHDGRQGGYTVWKTRDGLTDAMAGQPGGSERIPDGAWHSIVDQYRAHFSAPEMRYLLQHGVKATEKWLREDPVGRDHLREMSYQLSRDGEGKTVAEWLTLKQRQMEQLAFGRDDILGLMRDGQWDRRGDFPAVDIGLADAYNQAQTDLVDVQSAIADAATEDAPALRALQADRKRLLGEIGRLERRLPEAERTRFNFYDAKRIDIGEGDRLVQALKDEYDLGTYQPPVFVNGPTYRPPDLNFLAKMNRVLYKPFAKVVSPVEMRFARIPVYESFVRQEKAALISRGYPEEVATSFAEQMAKRETREYAFDLSARTSTQRFLKNSIWFAPAVQEVLTRWLVDIPSRYYWPVGALYIQNRAHIFLGMLHDLGVIHKDENGKDVIVIPGLGTLLDKLTGTKVPEIVTTFPQGFNIAGQGIPSLSTQWNAVLSIGTAEKIPVFEHLSNIFQRYGEQVTFFPAQVNFAYEAITGKPNPAEFASRAYQQQQYNAAFDQAVRAARVAVGPAPDARSYPDTPAGNAKLKADEAAYVRNLKDKATRIVRGIAGMRLFGASIFPSSLHVTDTYQQSATAMWHQVFRLPRDDPRGQKILTDWVAEHPGSIGYTVGRTVYTKGRPTVQPQGPQTAGGVQRPEDFIPVSLTLDQEFFHGLYSGDIKELTPSAYIRKLMGMESYRLYTQTRQKALDAIGTTAPEQLASWFTHGEIMDTFAHDWGRYLAEHDQFATDYQTHISQYAAQSGSIPRESFEVERLSAIHHGLRDLAPFFTSGGLRDKDFRRIVGQIGGLLSDKGQFGAPRTPMAKGLSWWWDNAFISFSNQTQPLYDQAERVKEQGGDPARLYAKIRDIKDQWDAKNLIGPDGLRYPSPEEVFYGNLTNTEQRITRLGWITEPPSWLSNFQTETAGYSGDRKSISQFFDRKAAFQSYVDKFVKANQVSTQSTYYTDSLVPWMNRYVGALANYYGGGAKEALRLENAAPYVRLNALGYTDDPTWKTVTHAAKVYSDAISKAGFSPGGYSEYALRIKPGFFAEIDRLRAADPGGAFNKLMIDLSEAMAPSNLKRREGPILYDALFFSNFGTRFTPGSGYAPKYFAGGATDYKGRLGKREVIEGVHVVTRNFGGDKAVTLAPQAMRAYLGAVREAGVFIPLASYKYSSFRTHSAQSYLYQQHSSGALPGPAAAPYHSNHERGMALDIDPAWLNANPKVRAILESFGWMNDVSGDPAHWDWGG